MPDRSLWVIFYTIRMNKESFYKRVTTQGYIDEGDSFEGCSNLDEGFSDYIEKIFRPWNLCKSFGSIIDSGFLKKSQDDSLIDILCYKTIRYIDIIGELIIERERNLTQNKNEVKHYSQREVAIFARYDSDYCTKFLGVYRVNEELSKEKNTFVFSKTSGRLYVSSEDGHYSHE